MKIKRAIRYLRISTDRQSNFSIDGQDMHTRQWCERNNVEIVDTFIDEGYSARNFDRPDMIRLNDFISKNQRTIDYLVVNAYDRFSRDAGEALVAIKKLQKSFGISIVSVNEGVTFDGDDPGSFFYAGLMLLKGEDEIIRNRSRINMGIYEAKKMQGRYLGTAPFGYLNTRDENNKPIIVPDPKRAHIIKYIFEAYLSGMPLYLIYEKAVKMGLTHKGNGACTKILSCHAYTGLIHVKAYKRFPEELVEGRHEPLISRTDWLDVQEKLNANKYKPGKIINDDMPMRGVLNCHCGLPLTGGLSTGSSGVKHNYYKCKMSGHKNNIRAEKLHEKFQEVLKYMSLTPAMVHALKQTSEELLEKKLSQSKILIKTKQSEYEIASNKLLSVEEKWINNQMSFDTYQRWYSDLTNTKMSIKTQIDELSKRKAETWMLLYQHLDKLSDLQSLYNAASTVQKQQLIKIKFDSHLYFKEGAYRTIYIMPAFAHNSLILKEKNLLILDKKRGFSAKIPSGGAKLTPIEPLPNFLNYIKPIAC